MEVSPHPEKPEDSITYLSCLILNACDVTSELIFLDLVDLIKSYNICCVLNKLDNIDSIHNDAYVPFYKNSSICVRRSGVVLTLENHSPIPNYFLRAI